MQYLVENIKLRNFFTHSIPIPSLDFTFIKLDITFKTTIGEYEVYY